MGDVQAADGGTGISPGRIVETVEVLLVAVGAQAEGDGCKDWQARGVEEGRKTTPAGVVSQSSWGPTGLLLLLLLPPP